MARELIVDDPGKIAVVGLDDLWMDENRWDVHLPPGNTGSAWPPGPSPRRGSPRWPGPPPIVPGRHRLGMDLRRKGEGWLIRVTSDGSELLTVEEARTGPGPARRAGATLDQQAAPRRPSPDPVPSPILAGRAPAGAVRHAGRPDRGPPDVDRAGGPAGALPEMMDTETTPMTPGRRTLRFDDFDEVMPDVERLLEATPRSAAGRWPRSAGTWRPSPAGSSTCPPRRPPTPPSGSARSRSARSSRRA